MGVKAVAGCWNRLDGVEKVFLAFLLFAQAYYSYRYAFRIQSDLAPPGYESTPEAYQYPKYAIAAAVLGLLTLLFVRHQESLTHLIRRVRQEPVWLLLIAFGLYIGLSAFRFGVEPDQLGHIAKFVFVAPFALAAAVIWRQKSAADFVLLFLGASLAYHVLYELVMFAHFEATGRWPALTFSQLVPRYGAGWDDPNGFGAFAVLCLIGVLFVKLSADSGWRKPHLALVFLITLMAALTYSMTAAAGLAIGCGLLLVARRMDVAKVAAMAGACLVVGAGLLASGHIDIIVEGKLKSIEAHTRTKPAPTGCRRRRKSLPLRLQSCPFPVFNSRRALSRQLLPSNRLQRHRVPHPPRQERPAKAGLSGRVSCARLSDRQTVSTSTRRCIC